MCPHSALVLVTGGAGFIGANLVRYLGAQGYAVRVLDNLSVGNRNYLEDSSAELIVGDILDRNTVMQAVTGVQYVVHLAARSGVLDSLRHPVETCQVNVVGTAILLEQAAAAGVRKLIFASSNAAVGSQHPPFDETALPRPQSPYGASKLAGEAYCLGFHHAFRLPTIALRFANAYGPFCAHKNSVVATFLKNILTGQSVNVEGDGQQTRDFIYVDDVCRAIHASLESSIAGEVLQIGTGREVPILSLLETIRSVCGVEPVVSFSEARAGDIRRNYSDVSKAERLLGFRCVTSLEDGIATTFRWLAAFLGVGSQQLCPSDGVKTG